MLLGGASTLLTACSLSEALHEAPVQPADVCRTPESLEHFSELGGGRLGYEISRATMRFQADPRFIAQLNTWADDWATLSGLGRITAVWSYGAYVDRCNSWHGAGRAFDFAEIEHESGTVSCRYDTWEPGTAAQLRNYWRLSASLHLHFSYTLTYLYNQQHHNHIHIDNAVSGFDTPTSFNQNSAVQVHFVQAALQHVFGTTVEINGVWDEPTRDALRPVQRDLGITTPLRETDGWRAFLQATARG